MMTETEDKEKSRRLEEANIVRAGVKKTSRQDDGSVKETQMSSYRTNGISIHTSHKMTQWSAAPIASLLFQFPVGDTDNTYT